MKKKVAVYKNIEYEFDAVGETDSDHYNNDGNFVRITEIVEVDFPEIEVDITEAKVAAIDEKISKANAGIYLLEQAKSELLALPEKA